MLQRLINKIKQQLRGRTPHSTGSHLAETPTAATTAIPSSITPTTTGEETGRKRTRKRKPKERVATPAIAASLPELAIPAAPWNPDDFAVEPQEGKSRFHDLDLPPEIMQAIQALGFSYCTPIQAEIVPHTLAGRDAFGKAQTGTGKSAAFLITILARLLREREPEKRPLGAPLALVLAPTRELAIQIQADAEDLNRFAPFKCVAVFGGTDYARQQQAVENKRVDLLIATPGRLLDFARQKIVRLDQVRVLVIDEADRLLDMGFIPDVRRIIQQTPDKSQRQTLFFSATLTPQITSLSSQWTREPAMVEIEPEQVAANSVEQLVYLITADEKFTILYNLISQKNLERVIVFCNRRDVTRRVRDRLHLHGINCAMLSGEVAQQQRMKTLENFKNGAIRVLVATDVAGRGLHIEGISHVVNFNLPEDAEDYVHRIGRTGRAGATGTSVSFADEDESFYLPEIENYMGRKLACLYPEDELLTPLPRPVNKPLPKEAGAPDRSPRRSGSGSGSGPRRPSSSRSRPPRRR